MKVSRHIVILALRFWMWLARMGRCGWCLIIKWDSVPMRWRCGKNKESSIPQERLQGMRIVPEADPNCPSLDSQVRSGRRKVSRTWRSWCERGYWTALWAGKGTGIFWGLWPWFWELRRFIVKCSWALALELASLEFESWLWSFLCSLWHWAT